MEFYFAVLLFCISTSVTPGPNTIMLMTSALNYGIRKTLPHYWGVCVGFAVMLTGIALGLGTLFTQFPWLHQLIKWAGAAYLVFLAWKIANAGEPGAASLARPLTFLQAAAFQWVNPKAVIIAIGAIATYTTPGENAFLQSMLIVVIFFVVGLFTMAVWLLFGLAMQRLVHAPVVVRVFNVTMALLLVLSVVPMLMSELPVLD